jgi:hypothetical protein
MINLCINCNTDISSKPQNKFCSRKCAAIVNNNKFPKRQRKSTLYNCRVCGKESRFRCCSIECDKTYKFETITRIRVENGEVSQASTLKNYITRTVGYVCVGCGNLGKHLNKPLTLQLDHIDGNSDNNLPKNLRLLCPNCHSQTETFVTRQKKDTKRNRYLRKYKGIDAA